MEIIKTGRQITQAVKNVGRLKQIVGVFWKHGFAEVVERTDLGRFIPGRSEKVSESTANLSAPVRLRMAFEELGPTFVKFGQLLSSRPDMIPESFILELKKLQDNVATIEFSEIKNVIEDELEKPLMDVFQSIDAKPLASASIGQVHTAKLPDGKEVIVKVQRPGIKHDINSDISILTFIANVLETQIPELRPIGPKRIVREFFKTMRQELNYLVEMNNARRIKENLKSHKDVVIPDIYPHLSTEKVLVMERLRGYRLDDLEAVKKAGIDTKKLVSVGVRALFKMIMEDGFFHGDLHAGNLFALEKNKVGLIDFGMTGRLSDRSRDSLIQMFVALMDEDYETLCYEFLDLGATTGRVDIETFTRDVSDSIAPHLGLNLGDVNAGKVLMDATSVAVRHNVTLPSEWMLVFKSIVGIEGLGRSLDPDLNIMDYSDEMVRKVATSRFAPDKITKDLAWIMRDLHQLAHIIPRQAKFFSKRLEKNDYALEFEIRDINKMRDAHEKGLKTLATTLLSLGFLLSGSLTLYADRLPTLLSLPWISTVCFTAAGLTAFQAFWRAK